MITTLDRVCSVVAAALKVPPEQVTAATSSSNLPAWNSLGHLQVILAVETSFGVRFRSAEMPTLDSIAALSSRLGISEGP